MPWLADKPSSAHTAEKYAAAIAKLREATGISHEGVAALLAFIKADEFWRKNALSPAGLLKRSAKNGERKIDNILVRMRTRGDRRVDAMKAWAAEGEGA